METVKEFFEAIKGQLAERLANPFTGAFCIAWVIWNFRLLMVFVGKGTYQEKFAYIDLTLYPDWRYWAVRGVVIPAATAVAYLWAYPRATRWLAEDHRKQQTQSNNLMKAAEGEILLSVEESRDLRTRFAEAEAAWVKARDLLSSELDNLRFTARGLAEKNAQLQADIDKVRGSTPSEGSGPEPGETAGGRQTTPNQLRLGSQLRTALGNDLAKETYTRSQLKVLSCLREGASLSVHDLAKVLKLELFEVRRAVDRLHDLALVLIDENEDVRIVAKGRAVLGGFVDEGQWNFAAEGF